MAERRKALCLAMAISGIDLFDIFEDDGSSDEDESVLHMQGFASVVPSLSDDQFQRHFRIRRETYELLRNLIGRHVSNEFVDHSGRVTIHADKQLLITLWMLATPDSYRSMAVKFGCSKSILWISVHRVINAVLLVNEEQHFVEWPSSSKAAEIADAFVAKSSFPGVLGAIDGTHIHIKAPSVNSAAYINRKGFHSIVLQAVCTSDLKFTDCYAGEVGSIHDATVFKRSPLYQRMTTDGATFPADTHIIGDAAYPLLKNVMVPFKDTGSLSARQQKFNTTLSSARCVIERAFALLKGRFRRLKYVDMSRLDLMPKDVVGCCILHNLCLNHNDRLDDITDDAELADGQDPGHANESVVAASAGRQLAVAKRNAICHAL